MTRARRALGSISLSETRAGLSELVRDIATLRRVAITVRGEVKAWLVAPELATPTRPRKRPLRGSLKIVADLDGTDTSAMAQAAAVGRAKRSGLT